MKKYFMCYLLILMIILSGCGLQTAPKETTTEKTIDEGSSDENAKLFEKSLQIREDNIASLLNKSVPFSSITVSRKGKIYSVSVVAKGFDNIKSLGNYVIELKKAFDTEFPEGERGGIAVTLEGEDNKAVSFFTQPEDTEIFGIIYDNRYGSVKKTTVNNAEEITELFSAKSANVTYNPPEITLAEFNSINTGMTYTEVCDIIGSSGELSVESSAAGITTKIYKWEGSGSLGANANVTFQGGKVVMKAQAGLK